MYVVTFVSNIEKNRRRLTIDTMIRQPSNSSPPHRRTSSSGGVPLSGGGIDYPDAGGYPPAPSSYNVALKSGTDNSNDMNKQQSTSSSSSSSTPRTFAHALLPDLPLLMHGSGDVLPECVNPHSVATLAQLVEKYVRSLVSAAMDAHDMFTDGEVVGGGACLGPPPFGATLSAGNDNDDESEDVLLITTKRKANDDKTLSKQKKKKQKIDYWDEPLPPPDHDDQDDAIDESSDLSSSDDDAPLLSSFRHMSSMSSMASNDIGNVDFAATEGFMPVDLHANERIRNYYVSAPTVMDARSFIFPICHDAILYQRIKEVQASRRAIRRDVVDSVVMDVMKEEGMNEGRRGMVDLWDVISDNNNDDKKVTIGGSTPTNKTHEKDKKSTADKKEGTQSANNIVGAGVLGSDVDPSWPGLNSLARGRLW